MIQAATAPYRRINSAFALAAFMAFANLYAPQSLLPLFQQEFAVSPLWAGMALTMATGSLGISLVFFGPLSDAWGRKKVLGFSLGGAVLVSACLPWVEHFEVYLALRGVQGFLLGGMSPIALAYMGEEYNPKSLATAVGIYVSSNGLGGVTGRLLSALVADVAGWRVAFGVLFALSALCFGLFLWLLPPSIRFVARPFRFGAMRQGLWEAASHPRLIPAYLVGGLNCMAFVGSLSFLTFHLQEQHQLSTAQLGLVFAAMLAGVISSNRSGLLVARIGQPLTAATGVLSMGAGLMLSLLSSLVWVFVGLCLICLGMFLAHSCAGGWVSRFAGKAKASANGVYFFHYYLGSSLAGFWAPPFWQHWGWAGVVTGNLLLLLVSALLCFRLLRLEQAGSALPGLP